MKKLRYVLPLALWLALAGCKDKATANAQQDSQAPDPMAQLMALHDEMMPQLSTINSLITKLEAKMGHENANTDYEKAIAELKDANKFMMVWMTDFGDHFTSSEILDSAPLSPEKKALLKADQRKMEALKQKMLQSIETAEALLKP